MTSAGIDSEGWRVPTSEEVTDMKQFFVAVLVALAALGSIGSVAWAGGDPGTSPDSVQAP